MLSQLIILLNVWLLKEYILFGGISYDCQNDIRMGSILILLEDTTYLISFWLKVNNYFYLLSCYKNEKRVGYSENLLTSEMIKFTREL